MQTTVLPVLLPCLLLCSPPHHYLPHYTSHKGPLLLCFNTSNTCRYIPTKSATDQYLTDPSLFTSSLDSVSVFPLLLYSLSALESRGWFWTLEKTGVIKRTNWVSAGLESLTQSCSDLETIFLTMLSCHSLLRALEKSQTYRILLEIS